LALSWASFLYARCTFNVSTHGLLFSVGKFVFDTGDIPVPSSNVFSISTSRKEGSINAKGFSSHCKDTCKFVRDELSIFSISSVTCHEDEAVSQKLIYVSSLAVITWG
jgi:hypothetical protein